MSADPQKIQRLIAMAERLIAAIESDIAALKAGRLQELRTTDPEIQHLSLLYDREAAGMDPARAKAAPSDLRRKFFDTTAKFRDVLALHARLLTRVRNASEGIVKAVAEEIERRRAPTCTYAPAASHARPQASAMVYNTVI
ncbi:MAG: hypothetical protein KGM97_03340 [Alphaproteobacteria bacterium]|nr:hypothetical protein [Alphaproteobacteria bacterium]MDE2630004.1 hypothetical protein [Alphaproteobacteria bacterium]